MRRLQETLSNLDGIVNLVGGNPLPLIIKGVGLFQSVPNAKKLYAKALADTWKAANLHELSPSLFENLINKNNLSLLNLNDLNKKLIATLQEQGDLEPNINAEQLFSKAVLAFEKKLGQQNPELMTHLFNEAIKDIEALRQSNQHELKLAIRDVRHEHGERLVALEQDLGNLKALPAQVETYLRNYAAELFLLRGILYSLVRNVAEMKELNFGESKLLAYTEHKQIAYALLSVQSATPLSTADLAEILRSSALKFPQPRYRAGRDMPSRLLNSEYEVVPFYGRDTELKQILEWCNTKKEPSDFDLKLYTGAGGMGKTRLMREVIRYLNASGKNWQAGFIDRKIAEMGSSKLQGLFKDDLPLFVVVDYAETQTEIVKKLLEAENAHVDRRTQPVRIVLLARTADTWWQQLRLEMQRIDLPLEAISLAPVGESREESFRRAVEAFAIDDEQVRPTRTPELKESYYNKVLSVHMRALLATHSPQNPETEMELLDQVLELEKQQWRKEKVNEFSQQSLDTVFAQVMTVVSLGYALYNKSDLRDLLKVIPYAEHLSNQQPVLDALAERLRELYPGSLYLEPLHPDILGEHLIERTLLPRENDTQTQDKLLSLAFDHTNSNPLVAVEVLMRLMQRREQSGITLLLDAYQSRTSNVGLAKAIAYQFSADLPISLYELAVSAGVTAHENSSNVIERATFANNLGSSYARIGQYKESVVLLREALSIRRELAKEQPEIFDPYVAMTLGNLASALSQLNLIEKVVEIDQEVDEIHQEALRIFRKLAQENPKMYYLDVAKALNNMGNILTVRNQFEEAVENHQEALKIYKSFSKERPELYRPDIATTFSGLGFALNGLGQTKKALKVYRKALSILMELVKKRQEVYFPQVVQIIANMGHVYNKPGSTQIALACWVFAFSVSTTSHNAAIIANCLIDLKQVTQNFEVMLKGLFPSGDAFLRQATGQEFSFYKETPVELADRIIGILNRLLNSYIERK